MTPNKPTTLRQEFEEKFGESFYDLHYRFCPMTPFNEKMGEKKQGICHKQKEDLKDEIVNWFIVHNTELIQKIEGLKVKGERASLNLNFIKDDAYNKALDDVIRLINQEK